MTKDLTTGSPLKLIITFTFPAFLGMLFQQFYNVVDTIIVGKLLGIGPLAGVGATGSLNFMVLGFCMGIAPQHRRFIPTRGISKTYAALSSNGY